MKPFRTVRCNFLEYRVDIVRALSSSWESITWMVPKLQRLDKAGGVGLDLIDIEGHRLPGRQTAIIV